MLIGASLKMYFSHARTVEWTTEVARILAAHTARDAVTAFVIPQYPSIPAAIDAAGAFPAARLAVGAQDVATEDAGPYTGEVSAAVLAELGCGYVEVGHAERRRMFGDTDDVVAAKTHAALRHGLIPIVCIGEPERVTPTEAVRVCTAQLRSAMSAAVAAGAEGPIVVAYEPLWAIGADAPAATDHIRRVCSELRAHLADRRPGASVIYGGSAGPGLLSLIADSVDGLFLGRFAHEPPAVRAILDEVGALSE